MKKCKCCDVDFEVTDRDREFLLKMRSLVAGEKYSIPEPSLCQDCRQQRRTAFRNERKLYKRKCDFSGRTIVSNYSPDKPYKVYGYEEWWGDGWDPLSFGFSFDFEKSFFEQFNQLLLSVPRLYLYNPSSENSEYTNHSYHNKNCYLIFNTAYNQDVYYSTNLIVKCKDCSDCLAAENGELLYWALYVKDCYNSKFLAHCSNCRDSVFLYDCRNCSNCFMCSNLRNKQYYITNKPYSKEAYEEKMKEYDTGKYSQLSVLKEKFFFNHVEKDAIHKNLQIVNAENSRGDYIFNSKNVDRSFYTDKCEDISCCYDALDNKDCMDTYESSIKCELQYECYACNESSMMKFCVLSLGHNLEYCDYCFNCKECFGCTGLKNKKYCIFNRQYSPEEYMILKKQIIEHMKKNNEYGEFFPVSIAPFGYNETIAQEYYPLSPEVAKNKGYKWKDKDEKEYVFSNYKIRDDIKDVPDEIINEALSCEVCSKNYKIIPQELLFYRKMSLPVPRICFDCRHNERIDRFRNPRKLRESTCYNCAKSIFTSYPNATVAKIYCEDCYLTEVH
jgi:hypothetical protein